MDTKSKVEFLYCTVEVRLKYPQGKSFFPAVWMLPSNDRSFPETDIFEVVGHHPETVYFVHHYMENGEKKKTCESTEIVDYLDFHTYKFEWTPYELIWFLDGEIVHRTKKNIYDKPMYLIMNFAVGGIWPGDPNEDTVFPSNVYIDYVRITPYVPEEKLEGIN